MSETKTVWITRDWEEGKIYPMECEPMSDGSMSPVRLHDWYYLGQYRMTEQSAINQVKKLASKRIASLQRKIDSITEKWLK